MRIDGIQTGLGIALLIFNTLLHHYICRQTGTSNADLRGRSCRLHRHIAICRAYDSNMVLAAVGQMRNVRSLTGRWLGKALQRGVVDGVCRQHFLS